MKITNILSAAAGDKKIILLNGLKNINGHWLKMTVEITMFDIGQNRLGGISSGEYTK